MNTEKAREYFSSYFEGSLDAGLTQTFERKLNTDAELQAEYRAFERTIKELSTLRETEAELPYDLNDKIQARLDLHIFEQKRAKAAPIAMWWRTLAFGGLAALAIFGTIKAIGTDGSDKTIPAGIGMTSSTDVKAEPAKGFQLKLDQFSTTERVVIVTDASTGAAKGDAGTISPEVPYLTLDNTGPKAEFVKVEIAGEKKPIYVAVPTRTGNNDGAAEDATIRGAMLRLAQAYGKPIILLVEDPTSALPITATDSTEPVNSLTKALGDGFMVEKRTDGLIWVQQH